MSELVSIIIPCYNAADFLERCVRSAVEQTYPSTEVICVDDGSTDATWQVLQELAGRFPELKLIHQENQGAPAARNAGLEMARGAYIQFLDADDRLMPEKIEHQMQCLQKNGPADMVVGSYRRVDVEGKVLNEKVYAQLKSELWIHLIETDLGCTCSNLFKKESLLEIGGWNTAMESSQETELMLRLLQKDTHPISDEGRVLTEVWVRDQGSISAQDTVGNWQRYIELRARMRDAVDGNPAVLSALDQRIFDACRLLYQEYPELGLRYLQEYLAPGFKPVSSEVTSPLYVKLYRLFGFKGAERIRRLLGR
ncbi:MAG: glycosyltransferase family 2 protein [Flavobacteriales bacterium]|nr:glycosyltransferase family 2 protein [Flavobacteriales bacterium]